MMLGKLHGKTSRENLAGYLEIRLDFLGFLTVQQDQRYKYWPANILTEFSKNCQCDLFQGIMLQVFVSI